MEGIKRFIESRDMPYYLKMKINNVVHQDVRSDLCGYHCIRFLKDRFKGIPFKVSTRFSDVREHEPKAKRELKLAKKFGYV